MQRLETTMLILSLYGMYSILKPILCFKTNCNLIERTYSDHPPIPAGHGRGQGSGRSRGQKRGGGGRHYLSCRVIAH